MSCLWFVFSFYTVRGMKTCIKIRKILQATIIYFHSTPEKFVASVIAVLLWFFSYRFIYNRKLLGIPLPGEGVFRYMNPTQPLQTLLLRRSSLVNKSEKVLTFMGMPISPPKFGPGTADTSEAFNVRPSTSANEERPVR